MATSKKKVTSRAGRTTSSVKSTVQRHSSSVRAAKPTAVRKTATGAVSRIRRAAPATGALGGVGGVGLLEQLDLGALDNVVTQLEDVVSGVGEKLNAVMSKLQEQIMSLQQAAQAGEPEATDLYNRAVNALQDAAAKGKNKAAELLEQLGIEVPE